VEAVVTRLPRVARCVCTAGFIGLVAASAGAQSAPQAPSAATTAGAAISKLWLVVGGGATTLRGDCQTCEEDFPYRHAGSVFGDIGYRVHDRMDVGGEVLWLGSGTKDGRIRTTHIDAVAQFRPWKSQGFILKGGAGMAFVRNWVDATGADAINSKALSVVIGAGWTFNPTSRIGLQVFGMQHAAALGDLQTATVPVADVMGNFWTLGAGIVFR
jgi:outer membrane protein with beta-barrel domain